jgi:hypothetical protein
MRYSFAQSSTSRIALIVLGFSVASAALGQGTVTGIVTDSTGVAVAHASVDAHANVNAANIVGDRMNPWIQADARGRFSLALPRGRYKIIAKDDEDGYPDPVYLLNADPTAEFPEITVGSEDITGVRVVLGKQGGVLEGQVSDRESRRPLFAAKITIRDAKNPIAYVEIFSDSTGYFRFSVPAKPILISCSADGHKKEDFAKGGTITFKASERRRVDFDLQRQ